MKKSFLLANAVALACIATSGIAFAATQGMGVSATIDSKCTFTSAPTTLSFGVVQPDAGPTAPGATLVPVTYKCTKGVTPGSFSASNGANFTVSRRMAGPGGEFIPYALSLGTATAGTGFGTGQDKTIAFTASIAVADYENATAGAYSDTVTLTVSP